EPCTLGRTGGGEGGGRVAGSGGERGEGGELPAVTLHVGAQVDGLLGGARDGIARSAAGAMARRAVLVVPDLAGAAERVVDLVGGECPTASRQHHGQGGQLKAESSDTVAFLHDNTPLLAMEAGL